MTPLDWVRHLEQTAGGFVPVDGPLPPAALGRSGSGAADRDRLAWDLATRPDPQGWGDLVQPGQGPLQAWPGDRAIEVWTEEELASLHGLWRVARRGAIAELRTRLLAAARWHLHNTQPDNATNRPWALHVFLAEGSDEGRIYAETLLHNATALRACLEPVSQWILRDAAAELRGLVLDR
jgi:hypothetical protein